MQGVMSRFEQMGRGAGSAPRLLIISYDFAAELFRYE